MEKLTVVQTIAAVIQAAASIVFFFSVSWEVRERKSQRLYSEKLREQERRDQLIHGLSRLWTQTTSPTVSITDDELSGFHSARKIEFYNMKLKEFGESWPFPFDRV
jgi:hypothetical protein